MLKRNLIRSVSLGYGDCRLTNPFDPKQVGPVVRDPLSTPRYSSVYRINQVGLSSFSESTTPSTKERSGFNLFLRT